MGVIVALCVLWTLVLGWPILKRHAWPLIAWGYRLRYEYQNMRGRRRAWRLLVRKIEPHLSRWMVQKVEKQLRLAGRPWPLTGVELLTLQILGGVGLVVFGLVAIPTDVLTAYWLLVAQLVFFLPHQRLRGMIKKRQLDARIAVRFVKRRLFEKLRLGLPLDEALRSVAEIAPGEFGETFRKLIAQMQNRPLKAIAIDLRNEYEVPEVDTFCIALEYSDERTPASLIESLRLQIAEEDDQQDEFIEAQLASATPKLYGILGVSVLFTLAISGYFFWAIMQSQWNSGPFMFRLF